MQLLSLKSTVRHRLTNVRSELLLFCSSRAACQSVKIKNETVTQNSRIFGLRLLVGNRTRLASLKMFSMSQRYLYHIST